MKKFIALIVLACAIPAYAGTVTTKKTKMVESIEAIDKARAERLAYDKAHGYTDQMGSILWEMEERKKADIRNGVREPELTFGDIDIPAPTQKEIEYARRQIDLANVKRSTSRQTDARVYTGSNLQDLMGGK